MPNLSVLAPTVFTIWRGFINLKRSSRDPSNPLWPNLHFFLLVPFVVNLHAKFEVFSSNRSGDLQGSQNLKSRSRDSHRTPFDLFFVPRWSIRMPDVKFLAPKVPEIWRRPKFSKIGHVTPFRPILSNFAFFFSVNLVISLHAKLKFLAQTFPEIWRGPKIWEVGYVTPFRPPLT